MQTPLRWAILGPGKIAHKFAQALGADHPNTLTTIASRSEERARAFADQYGAPQAFGRYEHLYDDPTIDVVYIATPHRFHFEQARHCIEAGKHVVCEKPLTVNAAQARTLIDLARSRNVFFMEALWSRYLPTHRTVRRWLDDGAIGDVRLLSSTFGFRALRDPDGRLLNHELAGGALLDLGVYNIAISQWVMQRNPDAIEAHGYIGETGVDELTSVIMRYGGDGSNGGIDGSGAISQFSCTFQAQAVNDFWIFGTEGHIRIHPMFWGATVATLTTNGGGEPTVQVADEPHRVNGFEYQIEEATRCIRDGAVESPTMSHADTIANMETMDRIRAKIGLRYTFE